MKWFDPLRGLALVTLLALQGCGGTAQEQSASQNATEAAPSEAKPFVVRHEDYKDADFRSTPRLQFTWSPPGAPDNAHGRGIWTIRLDGSDLRLAVPPELLYETGPGATNADVPFERSPDFRYIAVATQPQWQHFS